MEARYDAVCCFRWREMFIRKMRKTGHMKTLAMTARLGKIARTGGGSRSTSPGAATLRCLRRHARWPGARRVGVKIPARNNEGNLACIGPRSMKQKYQMHASWRCCIAVGHESTARFDGSGGVCAYSADSVRAARIAAPIMAMAARACKTTSGAEI